MDLVESNFGAVEAFFLNRTKPRDLPLIFKLRPLVVFGATVLYGVGRTEFNRDYGNLLMMLCAYPAAPIEGFAYTHQPAWWLKLHPTALTMASKVMELHRSLGKGRSELTPPPKITDFFSNPRHHERATHFFDWAMQRLMQQAEHNRNIRVPRV